MAMSSGKKQSTGEEGQEHENIRVVLCGASAYTQKYFFNRAFAGIPESIQEELHIICVEFTEEVGGVFTIVFTHPPQAAGAVRVTFHVFQGKVPAHGSE